MTTAPLRLSDLHLQKDPVKLYREMRRDHGPVVKVLLDGDLPAWLVIGYRELHQVTADAGLFTRVSDGWNQWDNVPEDWPLRPMIDTPPSILSSTGEDHGKRSTMINFALSGTDPSVLRAYAERFADQLIDNICRTGHADLIGEYAMLLPVRVMARLFGLTDEEGPDLVTALNDMVNGGERAMAGQHHLIAAVARLVADRRSEPEDDVVSRMLAENPGFSDDEIIYDLSVMLTAGHQPTADWLGNSLRLMLTDDRFAASMFGGRNSVSEAMNEVLWEETPTRKVAGRWATRDTQLGGQRIQAGDMMVLGLQGANSDPQVRVDGSAMTGANASHFSFGHGEHRCPFPAQEIAEVIARAGIEVVLDRLPDLDLAVPADELTRRPSPWLRGLTELPVRFTPTPVLGDALI